MSKENKANEIEYEQRMERAFELMLYEKKSYDEFKKQFAQEYDVTTRQAENVWKDVRTRLKERYTQNQEEILTEQLNRLYDLLNRCRLQGNRRIESEVLRDITKILGMEAPKKVDLTSNGETISININITE
jgi:tRNA A37 N6-isopentenylltransferase MiaA